MAAAAILVERDIAGLAPHRGATRQFEQVGLDPVARNDAAPDRVAEIAGLVDGEPARIDEEARAHDRVIVALTHVGAEGPHEI